MAQAGGLGAPRCIVGVGASAGGLEALERLFINMPVDTGCAFVVIQHLSPHFKSMMDELLARYTTMPVVPVTEPLQMQPNHIYLLSPGLEILMDANELTVRNKPEGAQLNMPINDFFKTLAKQHKDHSAAIVLSGTGSDGSLGLVQIKQAGGIAIVQSRSSAKFDGMPGAAAATGAAHAILPPEQIPDRLIELLEDESAREHATPRNPRTKTGFGSSIDDIIHHLHSVYDIDFGQYKPGTIRRRIERRVNLSHATSVEVYAEKLNDDAAELESLYKDLLIGVTEFFRDPDAFDILKKRVIPDLVKSCESRKEIRVWVPGCATGEEAYSLAILILEEIRAQESDCDLRMFATDRHGQSLREAAEGSYSVDQIKNLPDPFRERYFNKVTSSSFRVSPRLRQHMVFSWHNVIKDPPFTNIDLVSCRNVLIYFKQPTQTHVLSSFYFSIRPQGYLFLGPSETTGDLRREFRVIDRHWKVYQKVTSHRISTTFGPMRSMPSVPLRISSSAQQGAPRLGRTLDHLLRKYVPTGVLIDSDRQVLYLFGEVSELLKPSQGQMSSDVLDMATGNLRIALSSAIARAKNDGTSTELKGVEVDRSDSGPVLFDLMVEPIVDKISASTQYLITFTQERKSEAASLQSVVKLSPQSGPSGDESRRTHHFDSMKEATERIDFLESELVHSRATLQSTVEELETSNEELQASNEELLASNEELQSTNEELHSVNEELYSVNSEHEQKIRELREVTGDLRNLMGATDVGSVFTDPALKIRFFTPAAADILNLLPQDIGRNIEHITSRVKDDDFFETIAKAVEQQSVIEKHVRLVDGRVFLRRIKPYVDHNNESAGMIITFVEVTNIFEAQASQKEAEQTLRLATQISGVGIWEWELAEESLKWDQRSFEIFGFKSTPAMEVKLQTWRDHVIPEDQHSFDRFIQSTRDRRNVSTLEFRILRDGDTEVRYLQTQSKVSIDENKGESNIVGTFLDVTETRRARDISQDNETRFRQIIEYAPFGVLTVDLDGKIIQANPEFAKIFNEDSAKDLSGCELDSFIASKYTPTSKFLREQFKKFAPGFSGYTDRTVTGRRRDGSEVPLQVQLCPVSTARLDFVIIFLTDLTEALRSARRDQLMAAIVNSSEDAIISQDSDQTITSWNRGAERIYGYHAQEAIGNKVDIILAPGTEKEYQLMVQRIMKDEVVRNREVKRRRKNLSIADVAITLSPIHNSEGEVIGISSTERDISEQKWAQAERRRIEAKMIETANLESLGVLAGGIAHDFNNLLGGIMNSAEIASHQLETNPGSQTMRGSIDLIQDATHRASELCRQLLAYSGKGRFVIERRNLSELVEDTTKLLSASVPKNVELCYDLDANLPSVSIDTTQIRQVVMNLVINGAESLGREEGSVRIVTDIVDVDRDGFLQSMGGLDVTPGKYARLRVSDNGCGMTEDTIQKIFDPFYTTKFTGRGLGLSAVLGIIRGHHGGLWVDSKVNRGTTFTVLLPIAKGADTPHGEKRPSLKYEGSGRVLVVDDEPFIRESMQMLLQSLGFEVELACDGLEALETLKSTELDLRIVLLDLTMPKLGGAQTLRKLRDSGNKVPVILMSGFHHSEATAELEDGDFSGYLSKPFSRASLIAALQEVLPSKV